jgi:hypothetical protein
MIEQLENNRLFKQCQLDYNNTLVERIEHLEKQLYTFRNRQIVDEDGSGRWKSKDIAKRHDISPSRVAQLAPRRKYQFSADGTDNQQD